MVSFSDEGFHEPALVRDLLGQRGYVGALAVANDRYVGPRIGIHNPAGERVGRVSHLRNTEHLFVVGPDRSRVQAAIASARAQIAPKPPARSRADPQKVGSRIP